MILLLTLIITWIVRNWWKLLLLLLAVIILHEYQVRKHSKGDQEHAEEQTGDTEQTP